MAETVEELRQLLRQEQAKVSVLERKVSAYEQNGPAKLYYSLKRKMFELAELMNKKDLTTINLDDPKDKTFDRLKVVWNDASSIAIAVESLGRTAGITENEEADINRKPFLDTIAIKRD